MKHFFFSMLLMIVPMLVKASEQRTLVPYPNHIEWKEGAFLLTSKTTVGYSTDSLKPAAEYLAAMLRRSTGYAIPVKRGTASISLASSGKGREGGYTLGAASKGITIVGNDYKGVAFGIATLRQLLPIDVERKQVAKGVRWTVPAVYIQDSPRYLWRGLMIDASRHFFDVTEIKRMLDLMALYKLDKFHWHITDDQGWRMEVKKYPLLTQGGAWRKLNGQDRWCQQQAVEQDNKDIDIDPAHLRIEGADTLYGGYYTKQQMRDVVVYAAQRGIDVIPEVDQPGHSLSAIDVYPDLTCFKAEWFSFSSPLCLGKDKTLDFCKDVWKEVFDIFPYEYVHIGGDEVDMTNWKKCPLCQKRIKDNNLKDEHGLQAWFTRNMEKYFNDHGRRMIGWDEILQGGVSPSATVMWWRGDNAEGAVKAATAGHDLICCPTTHFYLDYTQNNSDMQRIYNFEPPTEIPSAQRKHILGLQGNIWAEHVASLKRQEYMVFPRIIAAAEAAWTTPENKNWQLFCQRMTEQYERLDVLDVNYRLPDIYGLYNRNVFVDKTVVQAKCDDHRSVIHYTTDGSIPTPASPKMDKPLVVDKPMNFVFRAFGTNGKKGEIVRASYVQEDYAPAVEVQNVEPGLSADWHEYPGIDCNGITNAPLNKSYIVNAVTIPQGVKGNIGLVFNGYIRIPQDGVYSFVLTSDDGSFLKIDGKMIVDNDGEHSSIIRSAQHAMKAGLHKVEIRYFDHNGGGLEMQMYAPDGTEMKGENVFFH